MQQLECRFYPRQEIAEGLSVNPKGSKHFAEKVKTTLDKWGYEYEYSRSGVEITGKPETAEERLREILIRKLNLDVQVDAYEINEIAKTITLSEILELQKKSIQMEQFSNIHEENPPKNLQKEKDS